MTCREYAKHDKHTPHSIVAGLRQHALTQLIMQNPEHKRAVRATLASDANISKINLVRNIAKHKVNKDDNRLRCCETCTRVSAADA